MQSFTLFELSSSIRRTFDKFFNGTYWIKAETSGVSRSATMQSYYFDLIEKEEGTQKIKAKAAAVIWSQRASYLIKKFEDVAQQRFESGLNVLVLVRVRFHEQYGFSLEVIDIDPSHTLGSIALRRQETIKKLKSEGLLEQQKQLKLPHLLRHIAVITSATAAGYGDFKKHIEDNRYGFPFALQLFPAIMQGDKTESSVESALQRIQNSEIPFDCVVIIRGGGAVSDLLAFDGYAISSAIARFPLPVISGIGHERDQSVVDMVAHLAQKTPTAVADFLIQRRKALLDSLDNLSENISSSIGRMLDRHARVLDSIYLHLPQCVQRATRRETQLLQREEKTLGLLLQNYLVDQKYTLTTSQERLKNISRDNLKSQRLKFLDSSQQLKWFIPKKISEEQQQLSYLGEKIKTLVPRSVLDEKRNLSTLQEKLQAFVPDRQREDWLEFSHLQKDIMRGLSFSLKNHKEELRELQQKTRWLIPLRLSEEKQQLAHLESLQSILNPSNTLKRGYSIVRSEGKSLANAEGVPEGTELEILLSEGSLKAKVIQ